MSQTPAVIKADARTVRELLSTTKYEIGEFQREYEWGKRQIEQLISDLESKFDSEYQPDHERKSVKNYARYYMGSIIVSTKEGRHSIIDGQQRLTSMTLFLIYLNNLQKKSSKKVEIDHLIFSTQYGDKSYNLDISDRIECMDALYNIKSTDPLYNIKSIDPLGKNESVKNIIKRYQDIEELFPDELKDEKLPFFIDWLIENVIFVEIKTSSDDDAYTIFETMNDRGLNLTSTEMLKGYLLSKIDTKKRKLEANDLWKDQIAKIKEIKKDADGFFKSWLRGKYAESIRPGRKGAENEDFEKIGTRFHNWVRENNDKLELADESSFYNFIKEDFVFFSELYLTIYKASQNFQKDLEHIFYISKFGVAESFYYPMLMASILKDDDKETINKKMNIVARFLETFHIFRKVNFKAIAQSSIRYTIYITIKEIRNKPLSEIAFILKEKTEKPIENLNENFKENLDGIQKYKLNQNKRYVRYLLARITHHIEQKSYMENFFASYLSDDIERPFEIEHIWANKMEYHSDEFSDKQDFDDCRNKLGALILIPRGFNQSYSDDKYEDKLTHYNSQNLLARSLNPQCYEKNPAFRDYIESSKLPFKFYLQFKKQDIIERQDLYTKICKEIWDTSYYDEIINNEI